MCAAKQSPSHKPILFCCCCRIKPSSPCSPWSLDKTGSNNSAVDYHLRRKKKHLESPQLSSGARNPLVWNDTPPYHTAPDCTSSQTLESVTFGRLGFHQTGDGSVEGSWKSSSPGLDDVREWMMSSIARFPSTTLMEGDSACLGVQSRAIASTYMLHAPVARVKGTPPAKRRRKQSGFI